MIDKRRFSSNYSGEVCRCCGSNDVHTREYNKPTMECIEYLRKQISDLALYPCADCGKLRTKAEGGTTFTVCEECWDKHYKKEEVNGKHSKGD